MQHFQRVDSNSITLVKIFSKIFIGTYRILDRVLILNKIINWIIFRFWMLCRILLRNRIMSRILQVLRQDSHQWSVARSLDSTIHWINLYPPDKMRTKIIEWITLSTNAIQASCNRPQPSDLLYDGLYLSPTNTFPLGQCCFSVAFRVCFAFSSQGRFHDFHNLFHCIATLTCY